MQLFKKKIQKTLLETENQLQSANHLVNILYIQLQDSKIILTALQQAHKAAITLISLALQLEYIQKRISLSKSSEKNTETFFKHVAKHYGLQKYQIENIREFLILGENYKKSGCTFSQPGKAIILNDDSTFNEISQNTIKSELHVLQQLIKALKTALNSSRKI